jgi:membrane-bound ClpP family serine protease
MCHILWMMPILALPLFWLFDFWVALPLYLGLLALSGVVMLLTVHSIKQQPSSGIEGMHGDLAEVVEAIRSRGRVRYHNELWYAESRQPLEVGETVRIVGNKRLCLLVEKLSAEPTAETEARHHCGPHLIFARRR